MKRKAFIQALIIFALLVASWVLVFLRFAGGEKQAGPPLPEDIKSEGAGLREGTGEKTLSPEIPAGKTDTRQPEIPEGWQDWIAALESAGTPAAMRGALADLRASIFSMPKETAVAYLEEMLRTGIDLRTGLAFQVAPDGRLEGAGSLRALLLDWLAELDPLLAARWAREELAALGTALSPDEYAVHLRNFAMGADEAEAARMAFLNEHLGRLLDHDPWLENPMSAVAHAFDVAVHTGATEFVPEFERLMQPGNAPLVRRASATTIEHLVDSRPVETLETLLEGTAEPTEMYKARAGYFARIDPALGDAPEILDAYLGAPGVSEEEIRFFIQSFPNLNRTLSHSLLGTQISATNQAGPLTRIRSALQQVKAWRADPRMEPFTGVLEAQESYLDEQLREIPGP